MPFGDGMLIRLSWNSPQQPTFVTSQHSWLTTSQLRLHHIAAGLRVMREMIYTDKYVNKLFFLFEFSFASYEYNCCRAPVGFLERDLLGVCFETVVLGRSLGQEFSVPRVPKFYDCICKGFPAWNIEAALYFYECRPGYSKHYVMKTRSDC